MGNGHFVGKAVSRGFAFKVKLLPIKSNVTRIHARLRDGSYLAKAAVGIYESYTTRVVGQGVQAACGIGVVVPYRARAIDTRIRDDRRRGLPVLDHHWLTINELDEVAGVRVVERLVREFAVGNLRTIGCSDEPILVYSAPGRGGVYDRKRALWGVVAVSRSHGEIRRVFGQLSKSGYRHR
jgi:hypothetical protein